MILEIGIGDSVAISFDDELRDNPPSPELVGDYLNRMARTLVTIYRQLPDAEPADATTDD